MVAGLLLAISPLHLWHSQEARMYTLVCLLGVFLAWGTVACRRGVQALLPALVACQAALLWTHHFSLFAIAASWVIVFTGHRVSVRRAVMCILLVAAMWLPAAWLLSRQVLVFRTGTWLAPPSLDVPLRSVGLWLAGVQGADHSRVAGIPLAIILVACAAIPMAVHGLRDSTGRVLAVLCGGTLAAAWAVSRAVPALVPGRYDVVLLPSFLLVLAAGWSRLNRAGRVVTLAALTAGSTLGILHYHGEYQKSSVRELVALVRTLERTGDVVVVVPEVEAPVVRYYYRGERPVLVPPSFGLVDRVDYADYGARWSSDAEARELADHCWESTPAGGRILLLYSPYRATAHFKGWLMRAASYTRVARRVSGSGSVELAILERASPAIPTELLNARPSL
jgi:hypothetical protein